MPNFIITNKYCNIKPPRDATLNLGHPLSRGLVSCLLFNQNAGRIIQDLIWGYNPIMSSIYEWRKGLYGAEIYSPGGLDSTIGSMNYVLFNQLPVSAIFLLRFNNVTSTNTIFASNTLSGKTWISGWTIKTFNPGYLELTFGNNTGTGSANKRTGYSNNIFSNNYYYLIGGVIIGASNMRIFLNGKRITIGYTGTGGNMVNDPTAFAQWGMSYAPTTTYFSGSLVLSYIYNRILQDNEMKALYESPYQIIKSYTKKFYSIGISPEPPEPYTANFYFV